MSVRLPAAASPAFACRARTRRRTTASPRAPCRSSRGHANRRRSSPAGCTSSSWSFYDVSIFSSLSRQRTGPCRTAGAASISFIDTTGVVILDVAGVPSGLLRRTGSRRLQARADGRGGASPLEWWRPDRIRISDAALVPQAVGIACGHPDGNDATVGVDCSTRCPPRRRRSALTHRKRSLPCSRARPAGPLARRRPARS